jgi:hypothetical protein
MAGPISDNKKITFSQERKGSLNLENQPILSDNLSGKYARLEQRFLSGMFENSNQCMRPKEKKMVGREWIYRPQTAYISSISLSLRYLHGSEENSHYEFLDNDPYRLLTYSDKITISQFEELVLESIDASLNQMDEAGGAGQSSRLIAINEFGFPFFRQDDRRDVFMEKLRHVSNKRDAFILSGSSHCIRRKQNIAILGCPRDEEIIEHTKFSPAINLGEKLHPKDDLYWTYYATALGRVGVLICFDAIDPSVLQRQIYFSRDVPADNRINLYIIPTFSPNDRVRDQAEVLSYFTKSIVLYTNCQYIDAQSPESHPTKTGPRMQSHGLFIAGEDVTNQAGLSASIFGNAVSKLPQSTHVATSGDETMWSSIVTHNLDYKDILHNLLDMHDDFSPLMQEILSLAKPDPSFKSKVEGAS